MSDQQLSNAKRWPRKRRSQRITLNVSVVVHRPPNEGPQFSERTQTLDVSAHGALVALAGHGSDIHQGGDGPLMSNALWSPNTDDGACFDAEPSLLHKCFPERECG